MSKPKKTITEFRSYQLPVDFPVLLLSGDIWRISDKPNEHLHFHNCLELGICHEGTGTLRIRGEDHPFHSGDITCIYRNIPHTTFSSPGTESLWSFLFVDIGEIFHAFLPGAIHDADLILEELNMAFLLPKSNGEELHRTVLLIIDELLRKEAYYKIKVRALLLSLFLTISRNQTSAQKDTLLEDSMQNHTLAIVPALEYIKQNYMNQFSVDHLADICRLSPTHFRRIFNLTMGTSPLEYLNTVRISNACTQLRSTEDSILNISERVGFHSISSFNRYFVRLINMSPREYRKIGLDDERLKSAKIMKFNGWTHPEA